MASPSQAPELSRNSANIAASLPAVTAASAVVTKHRRCGSESLVWDMQAAGGWRPPAAAAAAAACDANSRGSAETARQPDSPRLSTRLSSGRGCPSVEFSVRPRSASLSARGGQGPAQGPEGEVSPFTPTIVGYEVTEERAKFTVYKVRVERNAHDSWIVFRRYADFVRLHDKLRESFPELRMELPPKRWLRDNFHPGFLEVRQRGLQAYLYSVALNSRAARSAAVREFLCLDEPPGPFDSLEESRAFCESLEEANARLQRSLLERERELVSWRLEGEELRAALEAAQARVRVLEDARRCRGEEDGDGSSDSREPEGHV
ncbi:sorting nexin-16-like [Petromyzon marinus]|uniref:sorting nexin-16-like n=1 Tax=Petromyzon marinus TaxID=7757 RepID=UPI003F719B11